MEQPARSWLRSAPCARSRNDCRLCPLWLLPDNMPNLFAVGRGDGFASRPYPVDENDLTRGDRHQQHVRHAHRSVPGLYGLRDGLPFRRAIRQTDRDHPPPARTPLRAKLARPPVPFFPVLTVPAPGPPESFIATALALSKDRRQPPHPL